ncbi:hypothetical protein BDZ91DRAFT_663766 [Kalaharituber pfeilii]|nr:hypothetical protein BDZ91DRAFT_663766 [Kalaharituber pfeilii]
MLCLLHVGRARPPRLSSSWWSGAFLRSSSRLAQQSDAPSPSLSLSVQVPAKQGSRSASIASLLHGGPVDGVGEAPCQASDLASSPGALGGPEIVTVNGWIRSNRNMKKYSFLHISDGTTTQPLQAVIPKEQVEEDIKALTTGACIQITGEWRFSLGSKQHQQVKELHYQSLKILGTSDPETYPLQKKYHTPEYLRSMPHLRCRLPTQAALLQLRSWIASKITNFFVEKEFVQVHPPIITSSDCEGAGEVFSLSTSSDERANGKAPVSPPSSALTSSQKEQDHFFRAPKYLTVSSQLHLECFAHAVPKVWTLAPTFRAEKSDTNRHLSEFYMLEAEIAFTEILEDVMSVVEDLTRYIVSGLLEARVGKEMATIHANRSAEEVATRWNCLLPAKRWTRMTYTAAVEHLSRAAKVGEAKFVFPPIWGHALQAEHEKFLAGKFGNSDGVSGGAVFVTDYPRALKPFYMLPSATEAVIPTGLKVDALDTRTVACFDLLLPHVGELVGGSLREHRYEHIVKAMREFGLVPLAAPGKELEEDLGGMKWYADLRKWGSATHGGFGMGFDRLLAYLAGVRDIREVVGFPRWRGRCDC